MTSRQLGHRAAAHGELREAPVDGDPVGWILAYDAVEKHRKSGLDPNGHPPRIPALCARDVTKVCNCCATCQTVCWSEQFYGTADKLKQKARGIVSKLLRVVRR